MTERSPVEVAAKIDALGLWKIAAPSNWAVRLHGTAVPYFCSILLFDEGPVRVRFLMLEGWQTFHDYLLHRLDSSAGFYLTPAEMPHFEVCFLREGPPHIFRHDPGYQPRELLPDEPRADLCARILWQSYGVMMRLEADPKLAFAYADEQSMFARIEALDGTWSDGPLAIIPPRPHVESVSLPKADLKTAADLPLVADEAWDCDVTILTDIVTRDPRPRCVYSFHAADARTGASVFDSRAAMDPDGGLRGLWEGVPVVLLKQMLALRRIPGEVRVSSKRLFRLLRPLGVELPFKLSLHDQIFQASQKS